MGTMVDRESMENGARGRQFTRHVPGIVVEECSTEREFVEILCKFENSYVQLKNCLLLTIKTCFNCCLLLKLARCYHGATCRNHRQPWSRKWRHFNTSSLSVLLSDMCTSNPQGIGRRVVISWYSNTLTQCLFSAWMRQIRFCPVRM